MERSDWAERWDEGQIGFHQAATSHFLARHADRVWGAGPLGRVYVPLCGKTLDMVALAERATEVVGVEFVAQAVHEFFDERGLEPSVERQADGVTRFRAGPYTLYVADLFVLTADRLGPLDAVFDRASLVALDGPTRVRYADHMRAVLPPGARTLLITFDYDQDQMPGPPFSVSHEEVHTLFGEGFEVELLDTRDLLDEQFRARGLTRMRESAFALRRLS